MFENIKNIMKMRSEAKRAQEAINKITYDYSNGGISVTIRGDFTITSLQISKEALEEAANGKADRFHTMLTNVVNAAIKGVKKATQEQMMKMMQADGGLSGLFGK